MKKLPKTAIDPRLIYLQGDGFYRAYSVLANDTGVLNEPGLAAEVGNAAMVISAFNSEIFLKCLVCIETGKVPRGHHLLDLFNKLSAEVQRRIEDLWESVVVAQRAEMWNKIDGASEEKIARKLRPALKCGNAAFEQIRYSYEGHTSGTAFFLADLPLVLGKMIVELKPEWRGLRLQYQTLPTSPTC